MYHAGYRTITELEAFALVGRGAQFGKCALSSGGTTVMREAVFCETLEIGGLVSKCAQICRARIYVASFRKCDQSKKKTKW